MKAKRVRFKDSESEPNHPENSRFDICSVAYEAREDPPMPPAASNEPKTSEFVFFKKLKQDMGHSSCRKLVNRESIPMRKFGTSNHSRDLDVQSSHHIKESTTGEFGSFLSPKHAAVESSAMPSKEHDRQKFKCSSPLKTPISINLDLFLSTTENASVNPESQQNDGDIFSSKRLKLLQQISKTLFPDSDEVPKECNLVLLLLGRLLPESSQETLSQNSQLRQPETKRKCQLHLDSNVQLDEASNTTKLVKANEDHFLDSRVSAAQSHRSWETLPSGLTVEGSDASAARNSDRKLRGHKGNEQWSSLNDMAYECGSKSFGDRNLLTWGNEQYDYFTPGNTCPNTLKNDACKQFSYDAYDSSWSCRFRDHRHSYEVLSGNYDSSAASKSSSLVYKDGIYDFDLDTRPQTSPSSWCDSSSHVSLERFRPSAYNNLRDYTEPKCLNNFEDRGEFYPRLIGWNTDELHVHDSTQTTHMEIEIYHPSSLTCNKDLQDSPRLELYCPPSTWSEDPCVGPEKRNLLHLSPYSHPDHDIQGYNMQQKDLVPRSPYIPVKFPYDPEQLNPDDYGLSISRGSNYFYIPQKDCRSIENMMSERKSPAVEAFPCLPRFGSDSELKCKSLIGFLAEQYDKCTDDVLELFRPGYSGSRFLTANENNLATLQPEDYRSTTSVHVPTGQEDFLPFQLHALKWKDTEAETCDDDIQENSYYCGSLF